MIRSDTKALEARIMAKLEKFLPQSEKSQKALFEIGILLERKMKTRAQAQKIRDKGDLINSIKYEIDGNTLYVGSFGVPYAKYHEFGANLGPAGMRAMFAAMRARRAKSAKRYRDKNVVVGGKLLARPFVRPEFESSLGAIRRILAEYGAL